MNTINTIIIKIIATVINMINSIVNIVPKSSPVVFKVVSKIRKGFEKNVKKDGFLDFKPSEIEVLYDIYVLEDIAPLASVWHCLGKHVTWKHASNLVQNFAEDHKGYRGWKVKPAS